MTDKNQAKKMGINIIQSQQEKNSLFEMLLKNFPQTIKDNQVSLSAIKMLLGFNESMHDRIGYELTWTGKGVANALYSEPCQKQLKLQESFTPQTLASKHPNNAIIIGDNLDALKLLKSAYSEKIKMIYIDPPYNTGNRDFIYADNFRQDYQKILREVGLMETDENGEETESESLKFFKNTRGSREHSGWLSFMLPRLKLARDLLKEDGVIFISIDDNECANLKILCDEIFGEDNFVANLHVELSTTQGMKVGFAKKGNIVKNAEYILIYAKDIEKFSFIRSLYVSKNYDEHYSIYLDPKTKKRDTLLNFLKKHYDENMTKNKISALYESDTDFRDFIHKHADDIYQEHNADLNINLTHEQENKLNNNEIIEYGEYLLFKNSNNKIRQLIRLSEDGIGETDDFDAKFGFRKIRGDWWAGYYKDMGNINKEGGVIFKNGKKPIRLIKDLIKIATNEGDIILDFFAGSGTTAHAVMELNAEDEGNREFILVQIDEEIKEDESAYDFCKNVLKSAKPIISDITIERVKRAAQKIIQSSKESGLDCGFKVYTLQDKAQIANDKEEITLFNHSNLTPFDKALNLALQCGKTLSQPLEIIIKDKLYQCEDAYFCIVCDEEVREYLAKSKNEMIFLDGYEEIDLQAFLNLNAGFKERLSVVY